MMNGITFDEATYAIAVTSQMSITEARSRLQAALFDLRDTAQKAQVLLGSNTFPRVAFFRAASGMYAYVRHVHPRHNRKRWAR